MIRKESAIKKAKRAAAKKLEGLEEAARMGRKKYPMIYKKNQVVTDQEEK